MKRFLALTFCALLLPMGASAVEETEYECVQASQIAPYYFGGYLYVHAKATLPDGCYAVSHLWTETWPPELGFFACKPVVDGQVCTQQVQHYEDVLVTKWPAGASKLKVHFGDESSKEYDVIDLSKKSDAKLEDGYGPIPLRKLVEKIGWLTENGFGPLPLNKTEAFARKATGISYDFSYDEAFENALANLRAAGDGSTFITHAVVIGTGYQNGFIDDFLYVVLAEPME